MSESTPVRTYGNWRRPQSAGLFGLGKLGTTVMLGGLIVVVLCVMFWGIIAGAVVGLVLALFLGLILRRDRHHRNALTNATARAAWWRARRRGAHLYRSGPLGRTGWGTYQLPGLSAQLRLTEQEDSYGRRFAMLFCPRTTTYTVVIGAEPEGSALVDVEEIDMRVADWGAWLASLGDEPGVIAASVTIETAPDSGARLRREVVHRMDPNAPAFAQAVLEDAMDTYPAGSSTVRVFIAITFSAISRVDGKRRKGEEVGRDLAARLPGLTARLASTGAGAAVPLTAERVCELVRIAYDPAAAPIIEKAYADGEPVELRWTDAGPAAHQASWDGYRHDGAYSVTWAMSEAPRGYVQSGVLARLLRPHPEIARKRVTLLYRPVDSGAAAGMVEADARNAEQRVAVSRKPTARDLQALRYAARNATEEASGAGLINFGMLVSATVMNPQQAAQLRATVDSLGATARLRLRIVHGAQDSAFAAALPLGLVLPRHLRVPAELQEHL